MYRIAFVGIYIFIDVHVYICLILFALQARLDIDVHLQGHGVLRPAHAELRPVDELLTCKLQRYILYDTIRYYTILY